MATKLSLETVVLAKGSHETSEDGVCAMEMVAYLAGEPHSDTPVCCSPVLAAFVRSWNDAIPDDATRTRLLRPVLPRLIGTVGSAAVEQRRADLAFDWCVRVSTPAWLRLATLDVEAAALEALPPLLNMAAVAGAQASLQAARDRATATRAAAWDAAWDAVRAAAWDAAWAAAWDAARAAAWDAAGAAAWDAVRAAVWDAAWDAARAALQPTVERLQASARDLLDRMIAVTEADVQETA